MGLHPVLAEKLSAALAGSPRAPSTRRDARLADISGKTHAVIGMRRAGKTTFLRQLLDERRAALPLERAILLSFDDERLAEADATQLGFLLEEYFRRHPALRGRDTVHWFLDEIQLVPGWERFVRRVMDTERIEIVVSGSSAKMLSRELHTSLRGRAMATVIRPFSFREVLRHRGEEPSSPPIEWRARERSLVESRFREYLSRGGFPEAQGATRAVRDELLQGYVETVVFRDVVERHGVSQVTALRWVVRHCLRNPAGSFSIHRLAADLKAQGHGVAKDAVHAMVAHRVDAFLLNPVHIATDSERQRNSNPRKLYPADPGLIDAFDVSGRTNVGHALETVVLTELQRRGSVVDYVKTRDGLEVDFRVRAPGRRTQLIQVCADLAATATRDRELRALDAAAKEHPGAERRILVLDRDAASTNRAPGVRVEAATDWLLSDEHGAD